MSFFEGKRARWGLRRHCKQNVQKSALRVRRQV